MIALVLLRRIVTLLSVALMLAHGAIALGGVTLCDHQDGSRSLESLAQQAACDAANDENCCKPAAEDELAAGKLSVRTIAPPLQQPMPWWNSIATIFALGSVAFAIDFDRPPTCEFAHLTTTVLLI